MRVSALVALHAIVVLIVPLAAAQSAQSSQQLSPEQRKARILAKCEELAAAVKLIRLLDESHDDLSGTDVLATFANTAIGRICTRYGWRYTDTPAPVSNAPRPPADGKPWSWGGKGICRVEYQGHTRNGIHYNPAPPVDQSASISAWWDEKRQVYVIRHGCGRLVGASRSFSFDDQCPQGTTANPLYQPGCYYKCRDNYTVHDGRFSVDVDKATVTTETEDLASATWGTFKYRATCTFLKDR